MEVDTGTSTKVDMEEAMAEAMAETTVEVADLAEVGLDRRVKARVKPDPVEAVEVLVDQVNFKNTYNMTIQYAS